MPLVWNIYPGQWQYDPPGMTCRHSYTRPIGEPTAPSDDDLLAMRRAAWRQQGVIMLRPDDVRDDWARQALVNEANRLYGRRPGAGGSSSPTGGSARRSGR